MLTAANGNLSTQEQMLLLSAKLTLARFMTEALDPVTPEAMALEVCLDSLEDGLRYVWDSFETLRVNPLSADDEGRQG